MSDSIQLDPTKFVVELRPAGVGQVEPIVHVTYNVLVHTKDQVVSVATGVERAMSVSKEHWDRLSQCCTDIMNDILAQQGLSQYKQVKDEDLERELYGGAETQEDEL